MLRAERNSPLNKHAGRRRCSSLLDNPVLLRDLGRVVNELIHELVLEGHLGREPRRDNDIAP